MRVVRAPNADGAPATAPMLELTRGPVFETGPQSRGCSLDLGRWPGAGRACRLAFSLAGDAITGRLFVWST